MLIITKKTFLIKQAQQIWWFNGTFFQSKALVGLSYTGTHTCQFEEDSLHISAVVIKVTFEQNEMLQADYDTFGPEKKCQDTWTICTHCTKRCKAFVVINHVTINTVYR